jgi:hypothetical protein
MLTDTLEISYEVTGPPDALPVMLIHGWPLKEMDA